MVNKIEENRSSLRTEAEEERIRLQDGEDDEDDEDVDGDDEELVVCLLLHPAPGIAPQDVLPDLVVDEDEYGEGDGRDPPVDFERVHAQPLVHAGRVGEHGGQHGLEEQTEVEHHVLHALLEDRVFAGLADDEVGPLDHDDGDEEGGVAGVLQDLPVLHPKQSVSSITGWLTVR
jgi:hypothetical protein